MVIKIKSIFLAKARFGLKNVGLKNFGCRNVLGQEKFWVQKTESKNVLTKAKLF